MLIEKIPIVPEIMRIDTRTQAIDMQQIGNRRFLFNPKTGVLVLGRQYQETSLVNASHAVELADAGITKDFDDFVRGWIGTGRNYPKGVIHFAPCVDSGNISLFDRALTRWKCSGKTVLWPERWYGASGAGGNSPYLRSLRIYRKRNKSPPSGSS